MSYFCLLFVFLYRKELLGTITLENRYILNQRLNRKKCKIEQRYNEMIQKWRLQIIFGGWMSDCGDILQMFIFGEMFMLDWIEL